MGTRRVIFQDRGGMRRRTDLHDFVPMSKNEPLLDVKMEDRVAEFKRKAQPHQWWNLHDERQPVDSPSRPTMISGRGLYHRQRERFQ